MKKLINWILFSLYIFILIILALFCFWQAYAKNYIEDYIKKEYGNSIEQTYNNSELIKDLLEYDSIGKQSIEKN